MTLNFIVNYKANYLLDTNRIKINKIKELILDS